MRARLVIAQECTHLAAACSSLIDLEAYRTLAVYETLSLLAFWSNQKPNAVARLMLVRRFLQGIWPAERCSFRASSRHLHQLDANSGGRQMNAHTLRARIW